MRMNSTSFTHVSTAVFGVAVIGYAAVRVISYAAPSLPGHLPGQHAAPATAPVQQIAERRLTDQRASRSAHRSPAPTRLSPREEPPTATRPPSGSMGEVDLQRERPLDWQPTPSPTRTMDGTEDWRASHPATTSTPTSTDTHEPDDDEDNPGDH
jgi:hypothetical protein